MPGFSRTLLLPNMEFIGQIGWYVRFGRASSNMLTCLTNITRIRIWVVEIQQSDWSSAVV